MMRMLKAVEARDVKTIRAMIDVSDHTMVIGR
jgi:hypothetical protein